MLVKKSRKTIQRYIANGKLTVTRDHLGNPQIDTTELIRVFGKLSQVSQKKILKKSQNVAVELSQQNKDDRVDKLLLAVERLEKVVEKQSEQIASLLQLEHKPVVEQEEPEPLTAVNEILSADNKVKSGTVKNDYLYGMTFATKK